MNFRYAAYRAYMYECIYYHYASQRTNSEVGTLSLRKMCHHETGVSFRRQTCDVLYLA